MQNHKNTFGKIRPRIYTALATPFNGDLEIDWSALEKLVERQMEGNIDGIVIAGTTGESPTLTIQEKLALIRKVRTLMPKHVELMAGTGGNNTQQAYELSRLALEAGADSLLVVTPAYSRPSFSGLLDYYETLGKLKAPICLYHVPGRTGHKLTVKELKELTELDPITSVKEASGDMGFFLKAVQNCPVPLYTGDDPFTLPSLAGGGQGVISVVTNVFPRAMTALRDEWFEGNAEKALELHHILMPFMETLFCESNPGPVKAALEMEGFGTRSLRSPLASVTVDSSSLIKNSLDKTKNRLKEMIGETAP